MPKITFINHLGDKQTIQTLEGSTIMQAALDNNIQGIIGECGGAMACCTCHVIVDEKWIEKVGRYSDDELFMLEMIDFNENSRLCCQIKVDESMEGLVVNIPENQGL